MWSVSNESSSPELHDAIGALVKPRVGARTVGRQAGFRVLPASGQALTDKAAWIAGGFPEELLSYTRIRNVNQRW